MTYSAAAHLLDERVEAFHQRVVVGKEEEISHESVALHLSHSEDMLMVSVVHSEGFESRYGSGNLHAGSRNEALVVMESIYVSLRSSIKDGDGYEICVQSLRYVHQAVKSVRHSLVAREHLRRQFWLHLLLHLHWLLVGIVGE